MGSSLLSSFRRLIHITHLGVKEQTLPPCPPTTYFYGHAALCRYNLLKLTVCPYLYHKHPSALLIQAVSSASF